MFHAVREWWSNRRIKRTLGLFAFEFAVIVAGVLVAQAVTNYVSERQAETHMRNAWVVARKQIAAAAFAALGWQRAANCLDERMEEIMRSAARGEDVPPGQLVRPALRSGRILLPDDEAMLLLARLHGDAEAVGLRRAYGNLQSMTAHTEGIAQAWEGLYLLDPRFGPVSEADRAQARLSAARIKARLTGMRINAFNVSDSARSLGLAPDPTGMRFIRNCDDMWATGETVPSSKKADAPNLVKRARE